SGGTLVAEISGPNAGTGYDQVNITGAATLNGGSVLQVNTIGGFCPQSTFRVMTFGSRTGDFTTKTFNNPAGGTTSTTPGTTTYDVTITASCSNSADLTVTKTHSGNFAQGQTGAYTSTVSNDGLGPTSGTVTVVDTLPAGLT